MCGRLNVNDDPFVDKLMKSLRVPKKKPRVSRDIAPGGKLSIVHELNSERVVSDATWWLFLDQTTLKPNYKYASFNSRYDKLNNSRSISYKPFRKGRCIIPASGFVEGLGDKKTYHHIAPQDVAIAFGGLYKTWIDEDSGEQVISSSIITLPPHEKLADIHPKSIPLMLDSADQELMDLWLDSEFENVEVFADLLSPKLPFQADVTPIDRPAKRNQIGESYLVEAD